MLLFVNMKDRYTCLHQFFDINTEAHIRQLFEQSNKMKTVIFLSVFAATFMATMGNGPDDCDFEVNMCSWTSDPSNTYRWHRQNGSTPSFYTGPNGDATKPLNGKGYYIYAESSYIYANQKTQLSSPVFNATSGRCLEFAYNMYGSSMGSLDVYVEDVTTGTNKTIFTKSGNQGQRWYRANATITSFAGYKVVFEVTRGSSYISDVALDDIFFQDGKCGGQGPTSTTSSPWTTGAPTPSQRPSTSATTTSPPWTTSGPSPTTQVIGDDCDFDQDMCDWMPGMGTNKYSWTRNSGSTSSHYTGPCSDYTSGSGSYVYMETSYPAEVNQTATLVSRIFPPAPAGRCLTFYYHMYGATMGSLNVYIRSVSTAVQVRVFRISGNQQNKWHRGVVNISNMICDYEIVFEGVRGSDFRSDIALDDITFTNGPCPK